MLPIEPADHDTIALRAVRSLLNVAMAQGHRLEPLLEAAGFDFNPMEDGPEQVGMRLYSQLYRLVMSLLQDEAFGLNGRSKSPPGTFRLLCRYIIHASTLQDALVRMAEFFDFCDRFSDPACPPREPIAMADGGATAICQFYSPLQPDKPGAFSVDANVLFMMQRLCSWLIGRPLPLVSAHFPGAEPDTSQRYRELLRCPLQFEARVPGFGIASRWLEAPLVQTEESLAEFLRTAPYPLMAIAPDPDARGMRLRVTQLLRGYPSDQMPGVDEIASQLSMSARTLHRHLSLEGTSFQKLKDEYRRAMALAFMGRPELSITAISLLLGFQDSSTFYRTFRKWTGQSPGEFRSRREQSPAARERNPDSTEHESKQTG